MSDPSTMPIYSEKGINKTLNYNSQDSKNAKMESCSQNKTLNTKEKWSNKTEYALTVLGYSVGLTNLHRFPYLCLRNGGGAFLIPYFFFLFLVGIPLFVMEMYLGQYSGLSPHTVWHICPLFQGCGITTYLSSIIVVILYVHIMAWTLIYMVESMRKEVPWKSCGNWWNTLACLDIGFHKSSVIVHNSARPHNFTSTVTVTEVNTTLSEMSYNDDIDNATSLRLHSVSPAQEYFENKVLGITSGLEQLGNIQWMNVISYGICMIVVVLAVSKGVKSIGKLIYITAILPYFLITALIVRGITLPGSLNGLWFYLVPDLEKLIHFKVWYEALLQVFFTLGPGWGGLITMASHTDYNMKFIRSGLLLSFACCLTSFYAGFVTFTILGFLSYESGQNVQEVARSGPGLVFIAYPEAISRMPLAPVWAVVFFFMFFNVALEAQFVAVEQIVDFIMRYVSVFTNRRVLTACAVCGISFILGVPVATGAGIYIFQVIDWYLTSFIALIVCIIECVAVSYCYGYKRARKDMKDMLGAEPSLWWSVNWGIISPTVLLFMGIYSAFAMPEPYYGDYIYPRWAVAIARLLPILVILPVPIGMVIHFRKRSGSFIERFKKSLTATKYWKAQKIVYEQVANGTEEQSDSVL